MKNFIKLIERAHKERYKVVLEKIIDEKIPVTLLSVDFFEKAVDKLLESKSKFNLNITNLITIAPPPPPTSDNFQNNFNIVDLNDVSKIYPRPEYVLTFDWFSTRLAAKYLPDCKNILINWGRKYAEEVYEIFMDHLTDLQRVYESFIDEDSRKTFCGYWLGNISRRFSEFHYLDGAHYVTAGFIPKPGTIFIDCGTCEGSTSAMFAELGCEVYGFEMDKENFELAKKLASEKNFVVENFGLGSYTGEITYTHAPNGNTGSSKIDITGNDRAKIITLDAYVREKKLPRVDCIKFDVEGAELDILRGASTTIKRWKPILLLSAYHKWDDFWTLMNFVNSIRPDYEWALRQYPETRDSVPSYFIFGVNEERYYSMGLEPDRRDFGECCLLAR